MPCGYRESTDDPGDRSGKLWKFLYADRAAGCGPAKTETQAIHPAGKLNGCARSPLMQFS